LINDGAATDTVQITGPATLTDADFAHALSIEILRLDGASSITLGTNASAAGIKTVVTGNGATSITDSNSGTLTVNATALGAGNTLTLAGTTTMTVTGLTGNLNATGDSGALTVSANGTTPQTVATGSGAMSIANSATGGSVTVNAVALLGTSKLTLSGSSAKTVNNLAGNLVATGAGAIAVTATGKGPQTIETGGGNDTIIAATGGDTVQGGGGGDGINVSGHPVADSFIYAARSDSLNTSVGHDTITGFLASGSIYDQLDFSKLNPGVNIEGQVSSGSSVAADSIAWLYPGGNAMLYVNDTARALATGSTSLMEITLAGVSSGLSASNFRA
jgi:Ca2+-binding RTX toxin-like protein